MTEPLEEADTEGRMFASFFGVLDFFLGLVPLTVAICGCVMLTLVVLADIEHSGPAVLIVLIPIAITIYFVWVARGVYLVAISRSAGAGVRACGRSVAVRLWLLVVMGVMGNILGFAIGGFGGLFTVSFVTFGPSFVAVRHLLLMYLDKQRQKLYDV